MTASPTAKPARPGPPPSAPLRRAGPGSPGWPAWSGAQTWDTKLAGGNSGWCPELEVWTTHPRVE